MNYLAKIVGDIECHNVEGIKECFANGINANDYYNDQPLIFELISEYGRTPRFKDCVKAFIETGLKFDDEELLAVLSDDADRLDKILRSKPTLTRKTYSLRCAFTPMDDVSLLHICAEFNHVACARVLGDFGFDINQKAGMDQYGFGGQTPIFHCVNQPGNNSADMLEYLLSRDADLNVHLAGIIWGKGYPWETLIPAVNPISYAMMGLLPQMHRSEIQISRVVSKLLEKHYGISYVSPNIPNAYLR